MIKETLCAYLLTIGIAQSEVYTLSNKGLPVIEVAMTILKKYEGFQPNWYEDAGGFAVGYGFHYWDGAIPIHRTVADAHLEILVRGAIRHVRNDFPSTDWAKNKGRLVALTCLYYQLGSLDAFPACEAHIDLEEWAFAADELLWHDGLTKTRRSRFYSQTPARCRAMATLLRTN